jgi:hypothetical protein
MLNSNQSWFFHQYENTFPVNFSTSDLITQCVFYRAENQKSFYILFYRGKGVDKLVSKEDNGPLF